MLCGVRILDKSFKCKENFFRVEVWTKFPDDQSDDARKMKEYIAEKLLPLIREDNECKNDPAIRFSVHKTTSKSNNAPAGSAGGNAARSDY